MNMASLVLHDTDIVEAVKLLLTAKYGVSSWNGMTITTETKDGAKAKTYCIVVDDVVFGAQNSPSDGESSSKVVSKGAKKETEAPNAALSKTKLDLD